MDQLRKFLEMSPTMGQIGRVAYAFDMIALPKPSVGLQWQPVKEFCVADEVLTEPRLKAVFQQAIKRGYAFTRPAL
jgi:hypothetical protein